MSLTPLPPSPLESAPLAHFFCLSGHEKNGPLPAELKFTGEHCTSHYDTSIFCVVVNSLMCLV